MFVSVRIFWSQFRFVNNIHVTHSLFAGEENLFGVGRVDPVLASKMVSVESTVETGHDDMIHDAQMDYYGTRLATCSSDK